MNGINRETVLTIGQLVTLFERLGHQGPQTGVNRQSYPWGQIDGQEEYLYWSNNPTIITVQVGNAPPEDRFLVRTEYMMTLQ